MHAPEVRNNCFDVKSKEAQSFFLVTTNVSWILDGQKCNYSYVMTLFSPLAGFGISYIQCKSDDIFLLLTSDLLLITWLSFLFYLENDDVHHWNGNHFATFWLIAIIREFLGWFGNNLTCWYDLIVFVLQLICII